MKEQRNTGQIVSLLKACDYIQILT